MPRTLSTRFRRAHRLVLPLAADCALPLGWLPPCQPAPLPMALLLLNSTTGGAESESGGDQGGLPPDGHNNRSRDCCDALQLAAEAN